MKCLNMKVGDVLFFLVNFITIYFVSAQQGEPSRAAVGEETFINKLQENCPNVLEIIRINKLARYTINCKTFDMDSDETNIERVLQQACFLVKNLLDFMQVSKLDTTPDFFKSGSDSVCPFNFSHLEQLHIKYNNYNLVKELTNPDHCKEVCDDLYETKKQCIVLSKFNNFLKDFNQTAMQKNSVTSKVGKTSLKPVRVNITTQNTESDLVNSTTVKKMQESGKSDLKNVLDKEITKVVEKKPSEGSKNVTKLVKEMGKIEKPVLKSTSQSVLNSEVSNSDVKNEVKDSVLEKDDQDVKNFIEGIEIEKPVAKSTVESTQEIGTPKSETKNENENEDFFQEKDKLNLKNEESNEDDGVENEDDLIGEFKPGINQASNPQEMERSESKLDSSPSGKEIFTGEGFFQAEDSHFFFYFITVSSIVVVGYLAFHNKNKILAYALEGSSGRRSRRRPNPARYRKLETNLEEVISSSATNTTASSVVY